MNQPATANSPVMPETIWPYPGSRWWTFDFHAHTPASTDTPWHKQNLDLTPEQWLLKYMAAGIDCVAVTDHNSGAWIDQLKAAYAQMNARAEAGTPPEGFDGNDVSIRRSDKGTFDAFQVPAQIITAIEIHNARLMGNGSAERLEFSPYYNALIGGRGTGKSTLVHALRLALRRGEDLKRLNEEAEPRRQFERFCKVAKGRDDEGALRANTEIRVEWLSDTVLHRLRWRLDGQGPVVEERVESGSWRESSSSAINPERFPIRLFSQGQIAAMAGDGREVLLDVIDEAAQVAPRNARLEEAKRAYLVLRARLRELDGRLAGRAEMQRKLADTTRKIDALAQSHHADVLKAHQQARRQQREVQETLAQLDPLPRRIEELEQDLLLDDWMDGVFDAAQAADVLAWRVELEQVVAKARQALAQAATTLRADAQRLQTDPRLQTWRNRVAQAGAAYDQLQATLAEQGITDPQAFGRLVQERQQLEAQLKQLDQLQQERGRLEAQATDQLQRLTEARRNITQARADFVHNTLHANDFVRIEVVACGFDARTIERSLRVLLEVNDDRFESDLLTCKQRLIDNDTAFGGHFRNYLQKKLEKPEFADHVRCWFPEDDLRIDYSRSGDGEGWQAITQGSQGQRSAALLAFLLAFGREPLVLDQPEDDLDNHLIYDLIVRQIRDNKRRRQLIIVTHNANVVVNGDAEMVHAFDFRGGQCRVVERGALQELAVRQEVCRVMEGGPEAFARRWARLGREV